MIFEIGKIKTMKIKRNGNLLFTSGSFISQLEIIQHAFKLFLQIILCMLKSMYEKKKRRKNIDTKEDIKEEDTRSIPRCFECY